MTQASRRIDQAAEVLAIQPTTVWLGSTQGGLRWLRRKVENKLLQTDCCLSAGEDTKGDGFSSSQAATDQLEFIATLRQNVERFCESGAQRIVLGLRNRAELDGAAINEMQALCCDIPLALAVDTWFDGSRRTGFGETGALLLPWSRWWDGWHEWLIRPPTETLDAWTTPTAHLTAPEAQTQHRIPGGLIVADSQETADGWLSALGCLSRFAADNTNCVSSKLYHETRRQPAWVMLDDTADLLHVQQPDGPRQAALKVRSQYPNALVIIATTISRADQWIPLQSMDRCETVAKPSTGRSLRNLLRHYF